MIDQHSAEHYVWGEGCDGWHLIRTEALSIIQERMPPGASEVRHVRRAATQFFFVLHGTLSMEVEREEQTLSEGQGVTILPGQAHQVLNRSTASVEFLVVSSPPSHGDRVPAPLL